MSKAPRPRTRRAVLQRRARRLLGYWRAERRTLRQGSVALLASTAASFVAGITLGALTGTLRSMPGLIVLIPATVGMRGVISGTTGARLGTSIASGLFDASFRKGSVLRRNAVLGLVLTLVSSIWVALLARVATAAFGEPSISFLDLATISLVGGVLGSAVVLGVTIVLAVVSFRRGYDLDAVATPVVTAIGDMVTLPLLFLATLLVRSDAVHSVVGPLVLGAAAIGVVVGVRAEPDIRRTMLEMTGVLLVVPILDVLAGTLLDTQSDRFYAYPGLLVLIPPFVSQAGALGGILSSRLSSKLQLGVISPSGFPERPAQIDSAMVVVFSLLIFTVIGVATVGVDAVTGDTLPGAAVTIASTLLAGIFVIPLIIALGYYLAVGTTRSGLDPDNHAVPLITGVMDLTGIVALVTAMSLLGVPIHG
jgi:mgtE-like transporter